MGQLLGQSNDVEIFVDDFICRRRGNKERIKDGLNLQDQSSSNINSNDKNLVNLSKIDSFILSSSDEETKEKVSGRGKKSKGKKQKNNSHVPRETLRLDSHEVGKNDESVGTQKNSTKKARREQNNLSVTTQGVKNVPKSIAFFSPSKEDSERNERDCFGSGEEVDEETLRLIRELEEKEKEKNINQIERNIKDLSTAGFTEGKGVSQQLETLKRYS